MKTKKITIGGREIELLEFVPEHYLISDKANNTLNQLRVGVSTWVPMEKYLEMNISIWIYGDVRVNAFCCCIDEHNYIALSVGLFSAFWKEANEFVEQKALPLVFKLSEKNKPFIIDALFFYMLNFTLAHEFGHIAHGHLKDGSCGDCIDEMLEKEDESKDKSKNWLTQLKEYDADSFAVSIQSHLFLQMWEEDIKANLSNFDIMFLANYLCFRTFAEKTGRNFDEYFAKNIDEVDHPHPGIRMYYSFCLYSYWIGRAHGYTEDILSIIFSGSHAVIAYERNVLEKKDIKVCYYSVAYTEKGCQHVMNLNNGWQELIDYYNKYAYIPIEKLGDIDSMLFSLNDNGDFFSE